MSGRALEFRDFPVKLSDYGAKYNPSAFYYFSGSGAVRQLTQSNRAGGGSSVRRHVLDLHVGPTLDKKFLYVKRPGVIHVLTPKRRRRIFTSRKASSKRRRRN
jgi:hypothetical protein